MKILLMETHKGFQSTLPARGATRGTVSCGCNRIISIHAPRTGSDKARAQAPSPVRTFQSTLPARGATLTLDVRVAGNEHFNPRSPHGERLP